MKLTTRMIVAAFLMLAMAAVMTVVAANSSREAVEKGMVGPTVESYELRLAEVKPLLPRDAVVLYIGDDTSLRDYCMTRYVLAPVRLTLEGEHALAVASFLDPKRRDLASVEPALRRAGYAVEKDFGNGLFLLKRRAK